MKDAEKKLTLRRYVTIDTDSIDAARSKQSTVTNNTNHFNNNDKSKTCVLFLLIQSAVQRFLPSFSASVNTNILKTSVQNISDFCCYEHDPSRVITVGQSLVCVFVATRPYHIRV